MPTSEEHLRRLAEHAPPDERRSARRALTAFLGLVVVTASAVAIWYGVTHLAAEDGPLASAGDRLRAWWLTQQADQLSPPSADSTPVAFEIAPGETLGSVAARLETEGLIRDAGTFALLARVRALDRHVQAGTSTLSRAMTAEEILDNLLSGRGESVLVTLPEGWRSEQFGERLASRGLVDGASFHSMVAAGIPPGYSEGQPAPATGLEGYLFPDTYEFEPAAGAAVVIERMLGNFDVRLTPEMRETIRALDMTLHELVTLASIVEREATLAAERPMIARVFLNRLAAPPYLLNADPTIQYALGYQPDSGLWWKRLLTTDDLALESPYNTYLEPGLPPGPICNPGLASIESVIEPADGEWLYFVANDVACDGSHVFAATWEDHLANVARYRSEGCRH